MNKKKIDLETEIQGGLIRRKEIRRQKFKLEKEQEANEQKNKNSYAYERQDAKKENALLNDYYAKFS